jgi:hypothetical protein
MSTDNGEEDVVLGCEFIETPEDQPGVAGIDMLFPESTSRDMAARC